VSAIRQKRAARLIHLAVAFLLIGNAYGVFKATAHPGLVFIVSQVAMSIMIFSLIISGSKLYPKPLLAHNLFRIGELISLFYAAYYFSENLHLGLMSGLEMICAVGLCYLIFSEQRIYKKQVILIEKKGIRLPAAESQTMIPWEQIDNIRIRNDYVSVNTKQNRFIQYETDFVYTDAALDEINAHCFSRLSPNTTLHTTHASTT
jgi:hypothetical protein